MLNPHNYDADLVLAPTAYEGYLTVIRTLKQMHHEGTLQGLEWCELNRVLNEIRRYRAVRLQKAA